jgi:hypothetical protein
MNYITAFGIKFTGPKVTTLQFLYELYKRSKQIVTKMDCELFSFLDDLRPTSWGDLEKVDILHNPQFENEFTIIGKDECNLIMNFKTHTDFSTSNELETLSTILNNPKLVYDIPSGVIASYRIFIHEYNVEKDELFKSFKILKRPKDGYLFELRLHTFHTYEGLDVLGLIQYGIYTCTEVYSANEITILLDDGIDEDIAKYLNFYVDYEHLEELRELMGNHPNPKKRYESFAKLMKDVDGGVGLLTKIIEENTDTLNKIHQELTAD